MTQRAMHVFCREILRFRKALNLTAVDDEQVLFERFITPSLALGQWIPKGPLILLDLGSGMGIPGIPLLLVRSDVQGVLVERRRKRAEFLRHLVRTLDLNAMVLDRDIRELPPQHADVCVARAVASQDQLLTMFEPHLTMNGRVILPVPRDSKPVKRDGWHVLGEDRVGAGEEQLVRCYIYRPGGFT